MSAPATSDEGSYVTRVNYFSTLGLAEIWVVWLLLAKKRTGWSTSLQGCRRKLSRE